MLKAMSPTLMDTTLYSFDDQYLACKEEMTGELEHGHYFQKEIAANKHSCISGRRLRRLC